MSWWNAAALPPRVYTALFFKRNQTKKKLCKMTEILYKWGEWIQLPTVDEKFGDCFVTSCSFDGSEAQWKCQIQITKPVAFSFKSLDVCVYFFLSLCPFVFSILFHSLWFCHWCVCMFPLHWSCFFSQTVCNIFFAFFSLLSSLLSHWNRVRFIFIPLNCISYLLPVEFFFLSSFASMFYYMIFLCTVFDAVKMQEQQRRRKKLAKFRFQLAKNVVLEILLLLWYIMCSAVVPSSFRMFLFIFIRRFVHNRNVYDNQWTRIEVKTEHMKIRTWTHNNTIHTQKN